ncbi:MAG: D-sedoheptulose 7-phosphate isomerase [Nitrospina sp.]|jgi:D-sedoheptulose 7-phosphate isomerase|nr:D-sedoheptulose 7-phosphate isomerase [Nitrospina sp.]MBT6601794.1 D-sedoheptulose 7-phosphate isomerase [Nitrospina sp.]
MERIKSFLKISGNLKYQVAEALSGEILMAANTVRGSLSSGGKLLLMGNGGSAADCQHIAAELVGRFKKERKAIPALALTVDSSTLTALGNDYGFDTIFSRQVEAFATPKDSIIGISTSGNSKNVISALRLAQKIGAKTIGFMGNDGGEMKNFVDVGIIVPSNDTARIQEVHITIGHIICEIVEQDLIHENKI